MLTIHLTKPGEVRSVTSSRVDSRYPADQVVGLFLRIRPDLALIHCRAKSSGKVPNPHPVGAICNHNLGVLTVTKVAMKNADTVPPSHPVPRPPKAADPRWQRCGGPSVPLTFLARLPAWQSLCTGHVIPSLETCYEESSSLHRKRASVANTDRRGNGSRAIPAFYRARCVGPVKPHPGPPATFGSVAAANLRPILCCRHAKSCPAALTS